MIKKMYSFYKKFFHLNQFKYDYKVFVDYHFLQTQISENKDLLALLRSYQNKDLAKFYDTLPIDSPLSPNPLFDPIFYLKNLKPTQSEITKIKRVYGSLFNHFLNKGYKNQIDPHELFSLSHLRFNSAYNNKSNIWVEYVQNYRYFNLEVTPNFDGIFYMLNNSDVAQSGMNPLLHYVRYGKAEGRSPNEQIILNSDGYLDIYENTRISRKLIKAMVLEPFRYESKVVYELNEKIDNDPGYLTLIIKDAKSGFLFPTDEKIKIRNRLDSNIGIEIDLVNMDKHYILRKITNLYNGRTEFDYIKIIFPEDQDKDSNDLDAKVLMCLDFLIIKSCAQAKSTFIEGDSGFLRGFKTPTSILKLITESSNSKFQLNTFNLYKYGHQLRKLYLTYCTGFLTVDQKISSNTFTIKNTKLKLPSVSIVTCTNRPGNLIKHTIKQVTQQNYPNLEWVVMVQGILLPTEEDSIRTLCKSFDIALKIVHLDKEIKLGSMLNLGVSESTGEYIAKFDDDDFYLPNYLMNSINEAAALKADLVGKWMEFTYYESEKKVFYDKGPTLTYVETEHITGSSLVFKRSLFNENFRFYDVTHGEDVFFRNLLVNSGKKVYRIHGFDHIVFRSENLTNHTWQITDRFLLNETLVRNNDLNLVFDLGTAQNEIQIS